MMIMILSSSSLSTGEIDMLLETGNAAPDFELSDFTGKSVKLSDYRGRANVVLVFNRGFL
jgi:peroxiredoxin